MSVLCSVVKRNPAVALAAFVLAAFAAAPPSSYAQAAFQDKLKAAIVSKFPQFVEWPRAALADRATIGLCVAVPDPFGSDLRDLVAGETVGRHRVVVRRIEDDASIAGCHMLFIPAAAPNRPILLQKASSQPILTIGDDDAFLEEGGIVRLRLVDGRIRFDVDAAAAQRVGLRISSQLLQLALSVRGTES
jgi:uncharacterized protein DUF4154